MIWRRIPVIGIFPIFTLLLLLLVDRTSGIVDAKDYFLEASMDTTHVTWAHAVNSLKSFSDALSNKVMMMETDVMMGTVEGSPSSERIPILAHPPDLLTDMSLQDIIGELIANNELVNGKVGIKLDFKELEAAEEGLKILEKYEKTHYLNFPVWINADILQGPVNSTKPPINPTLFLGLVHKHLPRATLSLGWVTRYGRDDIKADPTNLRLRTITNGEYSRKNIQEMLDLLDELPDGWENPITFPVRAGMAARSEGAILHLMNSIIDHETSITLWSAEDDPVDLLKLRQLVNAAGRGRTYVDLPFNMWTGPGPTIIPDAKIIEIPSSSHVIHPTLVLYLLTICTTLRLYNYNYKLI